MFGLFSKYYYDVTKYNIMFSAIIAILTEKLTSGVVSFATVGILVSFHVYRHFNNVEYYFYMNGGLSKREIIIKAAIINFLIGSITTILITYIL